MDEGVARAGEQEQQQERSEPESAAIVRAVSRPTVLGLLCSGCSP